ncbi:DUF6357 family protein [Amycolatopsis lurida]
MSEVLFSRENPWMPRVVRADGGLRIELGAGADANHDPRTFGFPVSEAHLAVIRDDLTRHFAAVERDPAAVRGGRDPGSARRVRGGRAAGPDPSRGAGRRLVVQGADVGLLERGQLFDAVRSVSFLICSEAAEKAGKQG